MCIKNRKHTYIVIIIAAYFFSDVSSVCALSQDEIDFFNVGKGHAVLINKVGTRADEKPYVPLLVDAGSMMHPFVAGPHFKWTDEEKEEPSITKISERIISCWRTARNGRLNGGNFRLNVIITHSDKDHVGLMPSLVSKLGEKAATKHFSFTVHSLLGGTEDQYQSYNLKDLNPIYSSEYLGLIKPGGLRFLEDSGCITHLFCPGRITGNNNNWSIVTRIKLDSISAMITGDATIKVKRAMLGELGDRKTEICSDILLVPHHGSKKDTFLAEWDITVNPKAIVIGSAPDMKNFHPHRKTILDLLLVNGRDSRLWTDRVRAHGIQYYCEEDTHRNIEEFLGEDRLFDDVPCVTEQQDQKWRLVWVDLPIYTLWTTGSLRFHNAEKSPVFLDTSYGLMNYVAVANASYLLPPYMRKRITALSTAEEELSQRALKAIHRQEKWEEKRTVAKNIFLRELYLIEDPEDRFLYLSFIADILEQDIQEYYADILYHAPSFFPLMKSAITERNKEVPGNVERLHELVKFLMYRAVDEYIERYVGRFKHLYALGSLDIFLGFASLEDRAHILKVFLKATRADTELAKYINTFSSFNVSTVMELDKICPFGFPEWLQLESLLDFFRDVFKEGVSEGLCILDVLDIVELRHQGKNFKEIGRALIDEQMLYLRMEKGTLEEEMGRLTLEEQRSKGELEEKLKLYFPPEFDKFLT